MKHPDQDDPRGSDPFGQVDVDAAGVEVVVVRADATDKAVARRHPERAVLAGKGVILESYRRRNNLLASAWWTTKPTVSI